MKLSKKGQYAIKAMMKLTINYNDKAVTLAEISDSHSISLSYLEQLFSLLRSSGLVEGVRGPGGGYRLAKSPDRISIAKIILAIEESAEKASLKRNLNFNDSQNCTANDLWNDFSEQFETYLDSISLADVIKDQIVLKRQYDLDETTRRISTMFPVSATMKVA